MDTSAQNQPIVVERLFRASPERIWQALTDLDQMKKWYFKLDAFKPEPGFEFQFRSGTSDGTQFLHLCKITKVVPCKMLAYTWQYQGVPGLSEVSFELFAEGTGTRVVISHSGTDSFVSAGPDFALASFTKGWTYILNISLATYLSES
ncbi:MAG: SRPBCC domain-containing protein [Bacteroidota bacterium]